MTTAPETLSTPRLRLARPRALDAEAIFERYASDAEVTRYLGWPRHESVSDTRAFIAFSDAEWARWPAGPYLVWLADGTLIGGSGLAFETPWRASTGYVFARDAWGSGYAGEVLEAMVRLAPAVGVTRLYALCHPGHRASRHVLERGGFAFEAILRAHSVFPNLAPCVPADCACYAMAFNHEGRG
jgi:[ribosomal protein S5]-alanine N-acetyltransferase